MCRDAQTNTVILQQSGMNNLATLLTVRFFFFSFFHGWTMRLFEKDRLIGDKVRTKEVICKLIVANQFVALLSVITKRYGPEGFGQTGLAAGKKGQSPHLVFTIVTARGERRRLFSQTRALWCLNTQRWNVRQLNGGLHTHSDTLWVFARPAIQQMAPAFARAGMYYNAYAVIHWGII